MKIFLLFALMIFTVNLTNGQECKIPKPLEKEILDASKNESFAEDDFYRVNELLNEYEVRDKVKCLTKNSLYSKNIKKLFDSEVIEKRILAYRLIGFAKDSTFNDELINRINSDENSFLKTWSVMALLSNNCARASDDLFKLISSFPEGFPSRNLSVIYIKYNPDAVKKTCWKFIDSDIKNQQISAIQCLAAYEKDEKLQAKLVEFLNTWEEGYKGYVIYTMSVQKMENLKPVLEKYAEVGNLKDVVIRALKNSPTAADNDYAKQLEKN